MSACRPMLSSSPSVVSSLSVAEGRGEPETNGSNQTIFNADENQFLHSDTGSLHHTSIYLQLTSEYYTVNHTLSIHLSVRNEKLILFKSTMRQYRTNRGLYYK